jgi:IS66 Orf2 like protein
MLRPSAPDLRVYLHRAPIDMRAGRNGLAAIAREVMQKDPFDKTIGILVEAFETKPGVQIASVIQRCMEHLVAPDQRLRVEPERVEEAQAGRRTKLICLRKNRLASSTLSLKSAAS